MLLTSAQRQLESNVPLQKARKFQIAASAKMFHILSDSLYKHKELAIVRELTANAYDAHIRAKTTDKPFEIHLPTPLEPFFQIKDYGTGLSEQALYDLYTTYGSSDKTNSNDEIGAFGLGSKSPFAYADQFSIESRFSHRRSQFQAYINDHGEPTSLKISEVDTTEPNGLTITIPVANKNYKEFATAAAKVLPYVPIPYDINVLPQELQADLERPEYIGEIQIEPGIVAKIRQTKSDEKTNDYRRDHRSQCNAIMGIVAYPLDNVFEHDDPEYYMYSFGFDLYLPIGELDIAASRESLSYNEATKTRIRTLFKPLVIPLCEKVKAEIEAAPDLFEAATRFRNLADTAKNVLQRYIDRHRVPKADHLHALHHWFTKDPTWKGLPFTLAIPKGVAIRKIDKSWRTKIRITQYTTGESTATITIGPSGREKPAAFYWAEKQRPFSSFFESDLTAGLPAWLLIGPEADVNQVFTNAGLDLKAKDIELPVITRQTITRPNGTRVSYGHHRYAQYIGGRSEGRKPAAELEAHGTSLAIFGVASDAYNFHSRLHNLVNDGIVTTDVSKIVTAVIPSTHAKVIKGLTDAGAATDLAGFLKTGPCTIDKARATSLYVLSTTTEKFQGTFATEWPIAKALNEDIVKTFIAHLEFAGLDELAHYIQRAHYFAAGPTGENTFVSTDINVLMELDLVEKTQVKTEQDYLEAICACHKTMASKFKMQYPALANPGPAFRPLAYSATWSWMHDLVIEYLKSNKGVTP